MKRLVAYVTYEINVYVVDYVKKYLAFCISLFANFMFSDIRCRDFV